MKKIYLHQWTVQNYIVNDAFEDIKVTRVDLLPYENSKNQWGKLDSLKLKHNIITLNQLGIFTNVYSKYRKEVRGQMVIKNF